MKLLPGEQIILQSEPKSVTLTTFRIRSEHDTTGSGEVISILLEEVASCALKRSSRPVFLVLAALSFLASFMIASGTYNGPSIIFMGAIIGVIFVVLYFTTRRQLLEIASAGAVIRKNAVGMKMETAIDFIDAVEEAKIAKFTRAASK